MSTEHKLEWQRRQRKAFQSANGFSTASNYATGCNRKRILERDGYKCVDCGMSDAEHRGTWNRPLTIDHVDKDRTNNSDDNLKTRCLRCHGRKDLIPVLRVQRIPLFKEQILARRAEGVTYQAIADELGFSIAGIFKWVSRWEAPC